MNQELCLCVSLTESNYYITKYTRTFFSVKQAHHNLYYHLER